MPAAPPSPAGLRSPAAIASPSTSARRSMSARERRSVIATSRPPRSASRPLSAMDVDAGVDALATQRRAHRGDVGVEPQRELAHDRLLVQRRDPVDRAQPLARVVRAREQQLAELDDPAPAEPASGRRRRRARCSACAVQMFEVAFSRRMCCSRVCSVSTKPRRPSTSSVSPAIRPGIRRRYSSRAANKPKDGPPKSSRLPSAWPSPTATSTPHSPGGARMPSVIGSTCAHDARGAAAGRGARRRR